MLPKLAIVLVGLGTVAAEGAEVRTWKDNTGEYSVEADLVGVRGGQVHLRKADGSVIAVPLERLSEADRRHLPSLSGTSPAAAPSKTDAAAPSQRAAGSPASGPISSPLKFGQAAIERALSQRVTSPPVQISLMDLARHWGAQQQIAIELDTRALDDVGIATDAQVTAAGQGGTLEEALNNTLKPLGLAWRIRADMLVITSPEDAESGLDIGVYKIVRSQPVDDLLKDIHAKIAPRSWSNVGGPATCRPWGQNVLVVSQTLPVHRQIAAQYPAVLRRILPGTAPRRKGTLDAALIAPVVCAYVETPLNQVVADLSKQSGLALTLDAPALAEIGVEPNCPVTFTQRGISLESALTWSLRRLGLTWMPEQAGLKITTPENAQSVLSSATYDVRDLVAATGGDPASLVRLITATVAPQTWRNVGGPGAITPVATGLRMEQTYPMHRQVEQLLADLRRALRD